MNTDHSLDGPENPDSAPPPSDPQRLQQRYERWRQLYRNQEQAQAEWLEAETLFHELSAYYQSVQWREDHASNVPIECNHGEYCITSEDTLWDMLSDRDRLALRWARLGVDSLERK